MLLVADTRTSRYRDGATEYTDDRIISHSDSTRRVIRIRSAWVAGAGNASFVAMALSKVIAAHSEPLPENTLPIPPLFSIQAAIAEAWDALSVAEAEIVQRQTTAFWVTLDGLAEAGFLLAADGSVLDGSKMNAGYPLGVETHLERGEAFYKALEAAPTLAEGVRVAAREVAEVGSLVKSVSPVVTMGLAGLALTGPRSGGRYLCGRAATIAAMTDAEIEAAWSEPPSAAESLAALWKPEPVPRPRNDSMVTVSRSLFTPFAVATLGTLTSMTTSGTATVNKLKGGSSTPALGSIAAFWTGTNSIAGSDTAGRISLVRDTAGTSSAGIQCRVTFATPYAAAPFVALSQTGANVDVGVLATMNVTTTHFDVSFGSAIGPTGAGFFVEVIYQVIA